MGKKVLPDIKKYAVSAILFSLFIALSAGTVSAQTILSPGDLIIVTVNTTGSPYLEFVPLVNLQTGTTIKFTTDHWVDSESSFMGNGSTLVYTAPEEIKAGSLISYSDENGNGFTSIDEFVPESDAGHILVYQGESSSPRFFFGISWISEGSGGSGDAVGVNLSNLPASLVDEEVAVTGLTSRGNLQYTGTGREGNRKDITDSIGDINNWKSSEVPFEGFQPGFNLEDKGSSIIAFTSSSIEVGEQEEAVEITVELIESVSTAVEAEIEFVESLGEVSSRDLDGFSRTSIYFPAEAQPGDIQTITVPIRNDDLQEDDETAVLRLTGRSGDILTEPDNLLLTILGDNSPGISIRIGGGEGWRMLTVPAHNLNFSDFFGDFRMEGIQGSDNPAAPANLYTWNEAGGSNGYEIPASMSDAMEPGKGYLVYFFEDDDNTLQGVQGGFPKNISTNSEEMVSSVNVSLSATDSNGNDVIDGSEGWNLLGNPFSIPISVSELLNTLESGGFEINRNIYIWNSEKGDGNGGFIPLSDGDQIAPFQAFFVVYRGEEEINETISLNKNSLAAGEQYFSETSSRFDFTIQLSNGSGFDEFTLLFSDEGEMTATANDVFKLHSLNNQSINLYGKIGSEIFQEKWLPENPEAAIEIPLRYGDIPEGELSFSWEGTDQLPSGWSITLIDREQNMEVDLSREEQYRFYHRGVQDQQRSLQQSEEKSRLNQVQENENSPRFLLSVKTGKESKSETELPSSVKLNPNYPNPFNTATTITFELTEQTEVSLTVWNMIGQKVTTLVDGPREAGQHNEIWNAGNMPSGMYIAQLEVEGRVYIRKMTLIK